MQVTLDHISPQNHNVRTFWFRPEKPIKYNAGQFIELFLPHDKPDDRGIKRWFTLSSSPTEPLISITTKFAGDKSSTFKHALWALKPGAKLKIVEPMGDFVLPKDKSVPLVFVAGGMGVTPFRSQVKWLSDQKEKRSITLLLAANTPKDILFEPLFRSYGVNLSLMVSEAPSDWTGYVGHLTAEFIIKFAKGLNQRFYVSGPEPMVEVLEQGLLAKGLNPNQLVNDFFPGYKADLSS